MFIEFYSLTDPLDNSFSISFAVTLDNKEQILDDHPKNYEDNIAHP